MESWFFARLFFYVRMVIFEIHKYYNKCYDINT